MFKKTAIATLVCVTAALSAASANAFTIQSGDYKMTIDGFLNLSTYSGGCTSASLCDGSVQSAGAVGATGSEDLWGILSIASIVNTTTNAQYFTRMTNGYIIGSLTGLTNFNVSSGFGSQTTYATGGTINFYTSSTNYDPTVSSSNQAAVITSVTTSPLWLGLNFVDVLGYGFTYSGSYNSTLGTGSGNGQLEVTGGSAAGAFNTNAQFNASDASYGTTLGKPTTGNLGLNNWKATSTSDITGYSVPEPGSMALAGLALLGLAGLRRSKSQA